MGKEFIFTDADLDGAGCYLTYKWCTGRKVPYKCTRVSEFASDFKEWLKVNDITTYEAVYIFDLDVSDHIELVDIPNVVIVDHHSSHEVNKDKYKHAKVVIQEYSSCTKLVFNTFKNNLQPLPDDQKLLIIMIDDYDSYKLVLKNSYRLNLIFWNYQGNRLFHFISRFEDGFDDFTPGELEVINFYEKKLQSIKNTLNVHIATVPIQGKQQKMVSVFATSHINEVADHIIKNYKADIGFVVNTNSNKVSVRRSDKCDVDLGKLAAKLFDTGGGHKSAAGGDLCNSFLTFSKLFSPMSIKVGEC
jgi:oligoribonuclease NrnB/cAMP/cGMP phosphodiesterase (DHH superfamily)